MSRQFRHRVTAVVLGGLLLGAPLLTNGTANAGQVEGGGRQVVFGGGVLGLSCRSMPDVESMTVPAESTVTVVNRTGHNARLLLGGDEKGALPNDGSTQVLFRRGTTAVALDPDCTLGDDAAPTLVTAAPTIPAVPGPIPAPVITVPSAGEPSGSDSPPASTTAGSLPDSAGLPASSRPQRATMGASREGAIRTGARNRPGSAAATTAATQAMPQGGRALHPNTRTSRSTTGAAPALAGTLPGEKKEPAGGVPSLDLALAPGAAPAVPTTEAAAAEPVASMQPMEPERPIGLLALVASVCVIGVGVGAIRSFVAQRAYRSTIA